LQTTTYKPEAHDKGARGRKLRTRRLPTHLGEESVVIRLNGRKLGYIYPHRRDRHVSLRMRRSPHTKLSNLGDSVGWSLGNGRKLDYISPEAGLIMMSVCDRRRPLTPDLVKFNVLLVGVAIVGRPPTSPRPTTREHEEGSALGVFPPPSRRHLRLRLPLRPRP
jgi:hypothetical protein